MASKRIPTIKELLAVISEYNRAHELDLQEASLGAATVKNDFLENLYFAANGAAEALRPLMTVEIKPVRKSSK